MGYLVVDDKISGNKRKLLILFDSPSYMPEVSITPIPGWNIYYLKAAELFFQHSVSNIVVSASTVSVRVGSASRSSGGDVIAADRWVVHPDYNSSKFRKSIFSLIIISYPYRDNERGIFS